MPAEQALIIVNPAAGGRRARRLLPRLVDEAAARGARLVVTSRPGEAEEVAAAAGREGYGRVIAVGGDGTVQEVINGLAAGLPGLALGVVPAGSGNDFARSLRLPREPRGALAVALGAGLIAIDVAEATDASGRRRRFASAGGTGFDAQVATIMAPPRVLWRRGQVGYLLSTLVELGRYRNVRLRLGWEGSAGRETNLELDVLMVAFANGAYYGGGMRIAPDAVPDDGELDLCIVGDVSRWEALRQLPGLYRERTWGIVRYAWHERIGFGSTVSELACI